jgi:hypothetical protein
MWLEQNGPVEETYGQAGKPSEDIDGEEREYYMRKLGISNEIKIDTDKFKTNVVSSDEKPPVKEITVSPSTKKRFRKLPSIYYKALLFRLGAKAA